MINYGEITSQETGIYSQGGDLRIENHGSINSNGSSGQGAIQIISSTGDGDNIREVINTGIISGSPTVITDTTSATIFNNGGAEFHIDNSGSIIGGDDRAVYSTAAINFINNSGLIDGDMRLSNVTEMFNSGTIDGDVLLSNVADTFRGSGGGTITGHLDLAGGDDVAHMGDGGGTVLGGSGDDTVHGGDGSDYIDGGLDADALNGGGGNDQIFGDQGEDIIRAGDGDDDLYGGDEADLLRGGDGDDVLFGGRSNDILRAGLGDDEIYGEAGNDDIRASQGDDEVYGGNGNDHIRGGSGDDVIVGGRGDDMMFGGGGSDVFVFDNVNDSLKLGDGDIIGDFVSGDDQIDLSAFSGMTFIGTSGFDGSGAQVRSTVTADGNVKVFIDVDGDGSADMKFVVIADANLTETDFIL